MIERTFVQRIPRDESTEENRKLWRIIEAAASGSSDPDALHSDRRMIGDECCDESGERNHRAAEIANFG